MAPTSAGGSKVPEKRGHICPPSDAVHPKDRWETVFVYMYICKFTQLKSKVDGFNSIMDLEDALLTPPGQTNNLLQAILTRFILILRPQSRNIGPKQLTSTLSNLLADFFRTPERGVFWDIDKGMNIDPLINFANGFWDADWDIKLRILRQLVDYQLTHSSQIRDILDRAWGVKAMQHKKKEADSAPPVSDDPYSQKSLTHEPVGQDILRNRYWIVDDSPRLYISTNPWKVTQTFKSVASTRDEYAKAIEKLRAQAPSATNNATKRTRMEAGHLHLIQELENRLDIIDAELARVERARKKVEQRNMLLAQAEIRGPRTRRQTHRPDYLDLDEISEQGDDQDEYMYEDEPYQDEPLDVDEEMWSGDSRPGPRRSSRQNGRTALRRSSRNQNGKRQSEGNALEWRGERRSQRLGAPTDLDLDEPGERKRSRTLESSEAESSANADLRPGFSHSKDNGAAALKATEIAVETIKGKKKNKYWYYAVEPAPGTSDANAKVTGEAEDITNSVPSLPIRTNSRRILSPTPTPDPSEQARSATLETSAPMSLDSELEE